MSNQHSYSVPFTAEQLRADYSSGMTQVEIAVKYSVSQKVVHHAMRKFGIAARIAAKRSQRGSANSSWKGDDATYAALHKRVEVLRGRPHRCEHCPQTNGRFEWANVSGNYASELDYIRLCISCHRKFDAKRRRESGSKTSAHVPRSRKEAIPC
jgi:hypothetical protein